MPKSIKIKFGTTEKKDAELHFVMLKPSDSLKVLLFIGKILGGAVGNAISAFSLGDRDALDKLAGENANLSKLGDAIPLMLSRIEEKETLDKLNILLSSVTHSGNTLNVDYFIFDGRPDLLLTVAKDAIVENYRFFLSENSQLLEKLTQSKGAILASLRRSEKQTPTGSSGGQ